MNHSRTATGHGPDETDEREDTLDPTEVSEAFLAEIERIHCPVEDDELAAALETLAESSGDNVDVDRAVTNWQVISFLLKQRGGRLPKRYRL
jgi:hypothetical protein